MKILRARRDPRPPAPCRAGLAAFIALLALGCGRQSPDGVAASQQGTASVAAAPSDAVPNDAVPNEAVRIVSAGGSVTEVLYALGVGPALVGVDSTSIFPAPAKALPQVGYVRRLSAEGVISLRPSLFIATSDAEPRAALDQLRGAGVRVQLVDDEPGLEPAYARVLAIGDAVGRREQAEALVRQMRAQVAPIQAAVATVSARPSVLFVYARGQGSAQVAGQKTAAQLMIELAGGRNAVTSFEGFRPLTAEAVVQADPDFYLMPALGLQSLSGVDGLLAQPGIAQTRAGQARQVIAIDDSTLLGFGPRVALALHELAARLHPQLDLGPAPGGAGSVVASGSETR